VGLILDRSWQGALVDGKRAFDFTAYQNGFSLILAWGAIALILLLMTRETNCRQQA
jgi:hypothetical protein